MSSLRPVARVAMHVTSRQPTREHVDGSRRVEGPRHEDVDQEKLTFRYGVHRNVAIVVQQRGRQATGFAFAYGRHVWRVHADGACCGDNQTADEGAVSQLIGRDAEKIGDNVLVVARQARESTGSWSLRRTWIARAMAKLDLVRSAGKQAAVACYRHRQSTSLRAPCTDCARAPSFSH